MKSSIHKYFSIFILSIKDSIAYRNEMMVWAILEAAPLFGMLLLWLTIFKDKAMIGNYDQSAIIVYYVIGHAVQQLTSSHFEEHAINQIQQGSFNIHLIRPLSPKLYHVVSQTGWRIMTLLSSVAPVILLSFIFLGNFLPPLKLSHLFFVPYFLAAGYLIDSLCSLMIIAMGFIFEEAKSLRHLKWMLNAAFAGSMMPLDLMPKWLASASMFLPFRYRYYTTVQIFLGKLSLSAIILNMGYALIWIIALTLLMNLLWKHNIRKYTAVGS